MLTADTITDAQIRKMRELGWIDAHLAYCALPKLPFTKPGEISIGEARQRCALVFTARELESTRTCGGCSPCWFYGAGSGLCQGMTPEFAELREQCAEILKHKEGK